MARRAKPAAKPWPWAVRVARAHLRLALSALLGAIVVAALPASLHIMTRTLIAWDAGVIFYLAAALVMMARATVDDIARHADAQDEGAFGLLLLTIAAAVASLGAIFIELATLDQKAAGYGLQVALAIATVVLSWAFIHTILALHYAYEFYGDGHSATGLKFPDDDKPDYWDFIYFSFVIGMTFQVSDVGVTNKLIRRTVVAHGVLAFFFATAIIALTVSIAGNALQK